MSRPYKVHTVESMRERCVEEGDCWIWQGGTGAGGKPQTRDHGKVKHPRRMVRELTDGKPIREGMECVAVCGNVLCISPDCSVVTTAKGRARMASERGSFDNPKKNRMVALAMRARSHITDELVQMIKAANGPARAIAEETGVSMSHVKAIRRGQSRKDYSNPFAGLMG